MKTIVSILSALVLVTLVMVGILSFEKGDSGHSLQAVASSDGAGIYRNQCMSCHGTDGKNGGAPTLVFEGFHSKYPTEQDLKNYISKTMPKFNPGGLSDADYTALSSYIFSLNPKQTTDTTGGTNKKLVLQIVGKRIWLDNKEIALNTPPQTVKGKMMVPFRPLFTAVGLTASWNGKTQTISGKNSKLEIRLKINSKMAVVNGKNVTLDVAPQITAGSTLVPVRFVAETLGLEVKYRSK